MATISDTLPSGNRYRLHAYVCSGACVHRLDADPPPTMDFNQVFMRRPDNCRYAVTAQWDPPSDGWKFLVFDLFKSSDGLSQPPVIHPPKPRLVHDDLDAAILGTLMLYEGGE